MTTGTIRPATGTAAIARAPVLTGNAHNVSGHLRVRGWGTLVLVSHEEPLRPTAVPASPAAGPASQGR
jgi:hypothetical protein